MRESTQVRFPNAAIQMVLVASLLLAGAAAAQSPEAGAEIWNRLSTELDVDQDGTISREEFDQATSRFPQLDQNGDGVLTADDFAEGFGRKPIGGRLLRGADTDRDGTITGFEWQEFLLTADPDGDGEVDLAAILPQRGGRRGGPGFGGPGRGGSGRGGPGRGGQGFGGPGFGEPQAGGEDAEDRRAQHEARLLEVVDRNEDGIFGVDDLNTLFDELDQNADGELTRDELPQRRRGPRRGFGQQGFGS